MEQVSILCHFVRGVSQSDAEEFVDAFVDAKICNFNAEAGNVTASARINVPANRAQEFYEYAEDDSMIKVVSILTS